MNLKDKENYPILILFILSTIGSRRLIDSILLDADNQ